MSIIKHNKENLLSTRLLVDSLSDHTYRKPLEMLSGATIGEHIRHILEFYICIFQEKESTICYDDRERNHRIENDRMYTLAVIDTIILKMMEIKTDRSLSLKADYSYSGSDTLLFVTSINRELAYCLEHSIHHQALIKVAFKCMDDKFLISKDFGVAPSTIRYEQS